MAAHGRNAEAMASDLHKKIKVAFEAFDYEANSTVDVREIGTIIFSLGCFPCQADLHDFIAQVEEDHTGYIHLEKFLPVMTNVLLENKFPPIPEHKFLQAFEVKNGKCLSCLNCQTDFLKCSCPTLFCQVLDKEKKGYLEPEELTKYMMQEGEVFTQEEMDEMLTALTDQKNNVIYYKDMIDHLTIDCDI